MEIFAGWNFSFFDGMMLLLLFYGLPLMVILSIVFGIMGLKKKEDYSNDPTIDKRYMISQDSAQPPTQTMAPQHGANHSQPENDYTGVLFKLSLAGVGAIIIYWIIWSIS